MDLAKAYGIMGTPHAVINGQHHHKGRLTEASLLAAVLNAHP